MSVVVAFRYKDGIILGADKRISKGMRLREDRANKISLTKYSGHGMGSVGLLRHCNLLSIKDELMDYEDILEGIEVDQSYVIAKIVPNLTRYFTEQQAIVSEAGTTVMASEVMYVTKDKIFVIGEDFSVVEYPLWAAIGCGEEMVMGLLCNVEPEQFAKMKEADAIDFLLNGQYYMGANGPVYNHQNTAGNNGTTLPAYSNKWDADDVAIRCVRDAY
jgi:hypothetical protein